MKKKSYNIYIIETFFEIFKLWFMETNEDELLFKTKVQFWKVEFPKVAAKAWSIWVKVRGDVPFVVFGFTYMSCDRTKLVMKWQMKTIFMNKIKWKYLLMVW